MKFGFNLTTDEALEALDRIGVRWERTGSGIDVLTEDIDLIEADLLERDIRPDNPDLRRAYLAQSTRIYKDYYVKGRYFYLIKDYVFMKDDKVTLDYSTDPPTRFVKTIFDVVPDEEQGSWRDRLMNRPPTSLGTLL